MPAVPENMPREIPPIREIRSDGKGYVCTKKRFPGGASQIPKTLRPRSLPFRAAPRRYQFDVLPLRPRFNSLLCMKKRFPGGGVANSENPAPAQLAFSRSTASLSARRTSSTPSLQLLVLHENSALLGRIVFEICSGRRLSQKGGLPSVIPVPFRPCGIAALRRRAWTGRLRSRPGRRWCGQAS